MSDSRLSTGSTSGRPSISAQTRLTAARAKYGFFGSVTQQANRQRRLPLSGSNSGAKGTRGSTVCVAWVLRSFTSYSPGPS